MTLCGTLATGARAQDEYIPGYIHGYWSRLSPSLYGSGDWHRYGWQVALSGDGDRLFATSYGYVVDDSPQGYVQAFDRVGDGWVQVGQTVPGSHLTPHEGVDLEVSTAGDRFAVVAEAPTLGPTSQLDRVRVFGLSAGRWSQLGSDIEGAYRVAMSGDGQRIAVVDHVLTRSPDNPTSAVIKVFDWNGSDWELQGVAMSVSTDRRVQLDMSDDGKSVLVASAEAGATLMYELGDSWIEIGSVPEFDARWGNSALSGDGSRVALSFASEYLTDWNRVVVYQVGFGELRLLDVVAAGGDDLGEGMSFSHDGTVLAIGSRFTEIGSVNAGAVRVVKEANGRYWHTGHLLYGDYGERELFGWSVSLSADGTRLAAGASYDEEYYQIGGEVRVFDWNASTLAGDPTGDLSFTERDLYWVLAELVDGGWPAPNPEAADVDNDGSLSLRDSWIMAGCTVGRSIPDCPSPCSTQLSDQQLGSRATTSRQLSAAQCS